MSVGKGGKLTGCVKRVIVPRGSITRRISRLARRIADCYGDDELTVLAVLNGSLVFTADLLRRLPLRVSLQSVYASSYPACATRSRGPRFGSLPADLKGRHVLIVDDILDSGATMTALRRAVEARGPASVRTCVLLRKNRPTAGERLKVDFVAFDIDDEFVVGYGLDFNDLYRNLPDICVLKDRFMKTPPGGGHARR